jgi:hypothetical protein
LLPQCGGKEWREIVARLLARLRIGPDMNDSALAAIAVWIEKFAPSNVEIMRRASKSVQRRYAASAGANSRIRASQGAWPPS